MPGPSVAGQASDIACSAPLVQPQQIIRPLRLTVLRANPAPVVARFKRREGRSKIDAAGTRRAATRRIGKLDVTDTLTQVRYCPGQWLAHLLHVVEVQLCRQIRMIDTLKHG